jgi:glucose-1-phosphate thymidylyltransferase
VVPHVITGWWKDTGRLEDMLEANRIILDTLAPRVEGLLGEDVRLEGKVVIQTGAQLRNCLVRGPAIIGSGTLIEQSYVGPFTSIYHDCTIRRSEIEHSIVLEGSVIDGVDGKIESSLIGKGCTVRSSPERPRAYRLMLGDQSRVELR